MAAAAKRFKFGWFGDGGLGQRVIEKIVSGRKKATACLAYEAEDSDVKVGDRLDLVDKNGRVYGTVLITKIELRPYSSFDGALAWECGHELAEMHDMIRFANGRKPGPDEEMRVTYFELIRVAHRTAP